MTFKKIMRFLAFVCAVMAALFWIIMCNVSNDVVEKLMPTFVCVHFFAIPAAIWILIVMMCEISFKWKKTLNAAVSFFLLYAVVAYSLCVFATDASWEIRNFLYNTSCISHCLFWVSFVLLFVLWMLRFDWAKNICLRVSAFLRSAFSKENYFRTCVLIVLFIMAVCLILITIKMLGGFPSRRRVLI